MTAKVTILTGPAGVGKTHRLLEHFAELSTIPGRAVWLGPTQRGVRAIRERLTALEPESLTPAVFTFQDFAEHLIRVNDPTAKPLSNVQRRLLADDIVVDLHARGELSHFASVIDTRGFASSVFALLAELKRNEIWPIQLARAAYRRGYSGPRVEHEINGHTISRKDRHCVRIYAQYQRILIRNHLFDQEGRFWYARDLLGRGLRRPFEKVEAVFVSGFVDFTRTQHDMLVALSGMVKELWIALPNEPGEERAELFTVSRSTLASFEALNPEVVELERRKPGKSKKLDKPAGLIHLERQLFRPLRSVETSRDADGVVCIEAPGVLGEARMTARAIKKLVLEGVRPEHIIVCMRDLSGYVDLLREVFEEYGIPIDVEGSEPLMRNSAVATLIRALRLPEEDYPFAGVTALLRSAYFRPRWKGINTFSEDLERAEILLRLLGEPRGCHTYMKAVDMWADHPPPGLEDEAAQQRTRTRKHKLSLKCRPFLQRFFKMWDGIPTRASFAAHLSWLRRFAADLGLDKQVSEFARDAAALERLWDELESWAQLQARMHGPDREVERSTFMRALSTIVSESGPARTVRGPGRVCILSTEMVRGLDVPYLFIMGLGERSFPRLVAPEPFFDEGERQGFRQAGIDFTASCDLMPLEMLHFYQVVTRATQRLTLSYPAVDEKGQAMLPSSFLTTLLECFAPNSVTTQRKRMLIEGLETEEPLCPAEQRVRVAGMTAAGLKPPSGLPQHLAENLISAARLVYHRTVNQDYNPYDGMLRSGLAIQHVQTLFKPDRVISPTALEEYVACPSRFYYNHILGLEPLEEPTEEVENAARGIVFHRALQRLHTHLRDHQLNHASQSVDQMIHDQLERAVGECTENATPAGEVLWKLEGVRMQKRGARYRQDWSDFVDKWKPIQPQPTFFEKSFGLPPGPGETACDPLVLRLDGVEVRIGGIIDRVDLAEFNGEIVFWIIDYKTGRSSHYTASSLKAFHRLQLMLYAMAVERVMVDGKPARPLGLAYWLVVDTGPKIVLPERKPQLWLTEPERWQKIRITLEEIVIDLVKNIRAGVFPLKPRLENCTDSCPYAQICRITQSRSVEKTWSLPLPTIE